MKKPFFSVVIPTYNQAKFLNKALDSLKAQKYQNFEVIILDNFSTDETYKVIKKFSKKIIYKKIRNHGVIARSRNKGIKIAKGNKIKKTLAGDAGNLYLFARKALAGDRENS